ncbi:MAG: family 78 glycoside hydrolase catalytic domain [Lentisphaeria bacterium]|nr:family 78 glycoside hydrolase catalytic domain [Lentisphaeria bacterium]
MSSSRIQAWLYDPVSTGKKLSPVTCFRRSFESGRGLLRLKVGALGLFDCRLDGERITDSLFTPGWCDYRKRAEYHCFERPVPAGPHTLEILLGGGWYSGHIAGKEDRVPMLWIEAALPDGGRFGADSRWECSSDGPLLYSDIYMGESCDLTWKWTVWRPVGVKKLELPLEAFSGIPVRCCAVLKPVSVTGTIVDFGQNLTGRERLRFHAPLGTKVVIRHAEMLNPDGSLYTENLRGAKAENTVVATGGEDFYEPDFTFHGFRYLEVRGADRFEAEAAVIHTDFTEHLSFRCSNPLLTKLAENIRWGWLDNALDVPTDCPQRDERVGWTGDAQVFVRAAHYLTDCSRFFRRWLKDVRAARDEDGLFPIVAPWLERFGGSAGTAGWADAGVICPWTVYEFTGDTSVLEENYAAMLRFNAARWNQFRQGHVPPARFGDWLNADDDTPKEFLGTAFLIRSLDLTARAAQVLGDEENRLILEYRERMARNFFRTNYQNDLHSQTAMALALRFRLLDDDRRQTVADALDRHVREARGMHLSTGFLGTPHLLHALSENGHADTAWALLEQTTCPSWLFPVLHGATTVWERWNSWTPESGFGDPGMNSFNHYAYGAVLDWIIGVAAGIRPDFTLDPHPGGSLEFLEAEYRGLSVRWEKMPSGGYRYFVSVPEGCEARFRGASLPPGKHEFEIGN